MKKRFAFVFLLILGKSLSVEALEYGCRLKPIQLNGVGTNLTRKANEQNRSLDDSITIRANVSGQVKSFDNDNKNQLRGTIEGFYRPKIDGRYSLLPVPLFVVELSRVRNVLYICAHADEDPKKSHLTIYVMRGYDIDPFSMSNFFGDLMWPTQLKVKPIGVSFISLGEIREDYLFWLDWFPPFRAIYETVIAAQRLVSNIIGDVTDFGVERITLTADYVELAADINLNEPDKPKLIKKIYFDKDKK